MVFDYRQDCSASRPLQTKSNTTRYDHFRSNTIRSDMMCLFTPEPIQTDQNAWMQCCFNICVICFILQYCAQFGTRFIVNISHFIIETLEIKYDRSCCCCLYVHVPPGNKLKPQKETPKRTHLSCHFLFKMYGNNGL